jgi:hypothetical protein
MLDFRLEYIKLLGGSGLRARLYLDAALVARIGSTPEGYDWEWLDVQDGRSAAFGKFLAWTRYNYEDLDPSKDLDIVVDRIIEESQQQLRQKMRAA